MSNTKTNEVKAVQAIQPSALELTATVKKDSYVNDDGELKEFISVLLHAPFPDEDFDQVRIVPKWKSTKGVFEYKAKRLLKTMDSFELSGDVRPVSYFSKKHKRKVTYPGLFFKDPFGNAGDDRLIPFSIKKEDEAAVFTMLMSERFNVELEPDVALNDEVE